MVDPTVKLLLISSPKAGATLVERLMLARVNLTGAAMHYKRSPYPLKYSHEVFQKAKGRMPTPGHVASCGGRWLCLAIVRNPLDRAISSYIHTLLYWKALGAHFHELRGNANASFAEFAAALDRRAGKKASRQWSKGDSHFMPQSVPTNAGALHPGVLYVPIEMLTEPGGYACHSLARVRGTDLKAAEAAAQGNNSEHYITKATSSPPGSEHWSFAKVRSANNAHATPSYDSFWNNTAFCRHVMGCLYRADVEMYVSACRAPALETCAAFRSACEVQLGRLRDVCGLDV